MTRAAAVPILPGSGLTWRSPVGRGKGGLERSQPCAGRGTLVQVGKRWVVDATSSWLNDLGKLRRRTERSQAAVQTHLDLAAAIVTVHALIRRASSQYRWGARPRAAPRTR